MSSKEKQSTHSGYAIFRPTLFQGTMPACYDETDYPVVFPTELEAQREIADNQLTRIQEFLDGERDFNDAISTDEFILPVNVRPNGSISTEGGRAYGKIDWTIGFSKNAPDGVISNTIREPPLIPYLLRNGAGIVTRPRVENFTRPFVSVFMATFQVP